MPYGVPRYSNIDEVQSKWQKNAKASKDAWATQVSKPSAFDNYVKSIATLLGISESDVRASLPASNWKDFQTKAPAKADKFASGIDRAARDNKYKEGYKAAYMKRAT
jgi:hypothetical protein